MKAKPTATIAVLGIIVLALLTGCVAMNSPPVASFTRTPSSGEAPLNVTFNAGASRDSDGTVVSYEWSFGDGGSDTGATTSHTYQTAGAYTAVLRVTDNEGSTDTASRSITVTEPPPPPSIVHRVTAGQLLDEYDANEVAADMKYKGKLIAVSGYVDAIGRNIFNRIYVVLVGSPGDWPGAQCFFQEEEAPSVAQLSKGDYATIIGVCTGCSLFNVLVKDCCFE